jgi:hypothetical protein
MNIDPKRLYFMAEVADLIGVPLNQVYQAKYDNELHVQFINGEKEQVLGNDVIEYTKTEHYLGRGKRKKKKTIECSFSGTREDKSPSNPIIGQSDSYMTILDKNPSVSNLQTILESIDGDKVIHVNVVINNYYGATEQ